MAKLPYTYTICPDQEAPKQFTASCKDMGELLRHSPNGDLTINQKRTATWDMWSGNHMGPFWRYIGKLCYLCKEHEDMILNQGKLAGGLADELIAVIRKYEETIYMSTAIGVLELVKQQLIYENVEDDDETSE